MVEKLLKAFYVKRKHDHPPFLHNLLRLAELANLELNQEQQDLLDAVSTFNIRARYDDYKLEFYKICTKEFTKKWIIKIAGFREWIKKKL